MFIPDIKLKILQALRTGPLDQFQIAADLVEAPFRVRAELRDLRRDQLVREKYTRRAHEWELTDRGERIVYGADQLELDR